MDLEQNSTPPAVHPAPVDAPPAPAPTAAPRRSPWPWIALTLIVFMIVGSATFVFWRVETWPARTAGDVAQVFSDTFQFEPQITVDNQVVIEQTRPVAELAVTESRVVVERGYENRWLLSTKRMRARAEYVAKAGFDLQRDVQVRLDADGGTLAVEFPEAELLALDREQFDILEWDNGLWNRLNGEDTEQALDDLRAEADSRVGDQDLLAEARRSVEERLVPALEDRTGLSVSVTFRS